MSVLPYNWKEIKADKAFWDLVLEFKEKNSRWSQEELADEDEHQLHELAVEFVRSEGDTVFSVYFENYYGQPASSTVQELAGKFYVTDWAEPVSLCGQFNTLEDGARCILDGGCGDTFTGASSGLPADRMRELFEEAAGTNNEFVINGVMHVRTKAGFIPA
jgi:hypothetical protein